jgi:hypothetical protein
MEEAGMSRFFIQTSSNDPKDVEEVMEKLA